MATTQKPNQDFSHFGMSAAEVERRARQAAGER